MKKRLLAVLALSLLIGSFASAGSVQLQTSNVMIKAQISCGTKGC